MTEVFLNPTKLAFVILLVGYICTLWVSIRMIHRRKKTLIDAMEQLKKSMELNNKLNVLNKKLVKQIDEDNDLIEILIKEIRYYKFTEWFNSHLKDCNKKCTKTKAKTKTITKTKAKTQTKTKAKKK